MKSLEGSQGILRFRAPCDGVTKSSAPFISYGLAMNDVSVNARATLCLRSKSVSRASSQSLFRTSTAKRPAFRSAALLKKDCKRVRNSSGLLRRRVKKLIRVFANVLKGRDL